MAAVDQLPPVPTRGGAQGGDDASQPAQSGDISSLFQDQKDDQAKQDVQQTLQAMRQRVGGMMRQVQTIAEQFPAASKEADAVMQGFDALLQSIVKNSPGPEKTQPSPMVPA